ncbi:MAG: DUF3159 domain-containing protein [Rhodoluna sp.]
MTEKKPKNISRYGIKQTKDGYQLDGKSLLDSVGGWQGLLEASLPSVLYVLVFALTQNIPISIGVVSVSVIVLGIRHFMKKRPVDQFIGTLVGLGVAIYLTLRPGAQAGDYFLPGFFTNAAYGAALALSVAIRFPAIGLLVGFFTGAGLSWRKDKRKLRFFDFVTLLWVGMFALRLAIQVPLYLSNQVVVLGFVRLVMGIPLYLTMIWISWLLLRRVITPVEDGNLEK